MAGIKLKVFPALGLTGPVGPPGAGDVVGPAGALADNIAVFDGITGKLIKDGGSTISSLLVPPATVAPLANITPPVVGVATKYAREDHRHPFDPNVREKLTAARNYFVNNNAGAGSDANTGLSSGAAFATAQKAVDTLVGIDMNGFAVNIFLADSVTSYGNITLKNLTGWAGPGFVQLIGNGPSPANVIVGQLLVSNHATAWQVDGMRLNNPGGTGLNIQGATATILYGRIELGNLSVAIGNSGGTVRTIGFPVVIAGVSSVLFYQEGGVASHTIAVTFKGCPDFGQYARVNYMGMCYMHGSTFTYTAATFDPATDRVTVAAHGRNANDPVSFNFTGGGSMPAPLVANTNYFVKTVIDPNTFTVSATAGGALIDITSAGLNGIAVPHSVAGAGLKYSVTNNSVLFVNGAGTGFLPGNVAGSSDASSVYA